MLIQVEMGHFFTISLHSQIMRMLFQNGVKIEDMISLCRPNGRSMTAVTALMFFFHSGYNNTLTEYVRYHKLLPRYNVIRHV